LTRRPRKSSIGICELVYRCPMKPSSTWQDIAERLAESGWSWRHVVLPNRATPALHVAEARNEAGQRHAVVADSVAPAFAALEKSVQSAGA
jgi:hypothetical protein